ncbi:serine/threonine protein kinase [Chthoniobacter flavus Ellin428]|uniref:Serine/threonine protein kinase n=2 Tax=Chthoniobacter flavus TaxID=191863 RepID=B4CV31_9BACT|nr:serine/threonine-protein kinase [Chthoniobacter flavus]EDY22419.1 serine/threonine protein kinase [Chthoniobacter flavus Ellin428]
MNLGTDTLTDAEAAAGRPAAPTPEELTPHFPQLDILECLGRGGMGVVYQARQKSLNRLVALKLLAPERAGDADFAKRFAQEAQALAALSHPHIVTVHDFGQAGGFYYLLMEFIDGVNLRQAMQAGRFKPEQALAIVPPICAALQYAHEHGIVHRDIKPENLLLDKEGRVKIADFGIAKMLGEESSTGIAESQPAGTPQYMAPEQKQHQRTDHRADIYSLGVVLYEMLTGELPGEKLQPPSSRLRGLQIDVRLDEIVLRALEKAPEMRFQTAAELRTQVETVASHPTASAKANPAPGAPPRVLKIGMAYVTTPDQLRTFEGRFFLHRTNTQLHLDEQQLSFALARTPTSIPLAAIGDLSIGHFPRMMNPAGINYISVSYEEGGETRRVLLTPNEGLIDSPGHVNRLGAEWFAAIRDAVTATTGKAPATTPAEQLGLPSSPAALAVWAMILLPALLLLLVTFSIAGSGSFLTPLNTTLIGVLVLGSLAVVYRYSRGRERVAGDSATREPGSAGNTKSRHAWVWLVSGIVAVIVFGFFVLCAGVFWLYGRAASSNRQAVAQQATAIAREAAARQAAEARTAHSPHQPNTKTEIHLVPQSVVDSARAARDRATKLFQAGFKDPSAVSKAEEQLRWAEAMYAGDRLRAALARRDGAKERLTLLQRQRLALRGQSGPVPVDDELTAAERELAEAEARVGELQMSGTPNGGLLPVTQSNGHLVPQSVVDSAREALDVAQKRFEAGNIDQVTCMKAREQLQWAEAMFVGDRLGAAKARRDGARERLEVLKQMSLAGRASPEDMAAVERETAEAEAQVSELQGASRSTTPGAK